MRIRRPLYLTGVVLICTGACGGSSDGPTGGTQSGSSGTSVDASDTSATSDGAASTTADATSGEASTSAASAGDTTESTTSSGGGASTTTSGDANGLLLEYGAFEEIGVEAGSTELPYASYAYFPAGTLGPGQSPFVFMMISESPGLCEDLESGVGRPNEFYALMDIPNPTREKDGSFTPMSYGPAQSVGAEVSLADGTCDGRASTGNAGLFLDVLESQPDSFLLEVGSASWDVQGVGLEGSVLVTECELSTIAATKMLEGC